MLKKSLFLLQFVLLSSCLTNYHEFEIDNFEEQVVVQAIVNNTSNIEVLLSENSLITGDIDIVGLPGSSMKIFEDGLFWDSLVWVEINSNYQISGLYSSNKLMVPGKNYRLECGVSDSTNIVANTYLPLPTNIEILKIDTLLIQDEHWSDQYLRILINIEMPEELSYYSLYIKEDNFDRSVKYSINDPVIGKWNYSIEADYPVFSNEFIPNKSYEFSIILDENLSFFNNTRYISVELLSLSADMYYYLQSRTAAKNTDLRINEPAMVYSNINGGMGIFAGYTSTVDSLLISSEEIFY